MARYKYTSNKDPLDGTEEIRLPGRDPVSKGGEIELTDAEHALLKDRLNLRSVEDKSEETQGDSNQGEESPAKK